MPKNHIKATLEELHEELRDLGTVDPSLLDPLRKLDADIHQLLDADEFKPSEANRLVERVEELGADFAAKHPQAERFFQELIATLGRLGV